MLPRLPRYRGRDGDVTGTRNRKPPDPRRAKALKYFGAERLEITLVIRGLVRATVHAAPGDRSGISQAAEVEFAAGVWTCSEHPGENACAHRLVAQYATGHGGRCKGNWRVPQPGDDVGDPRGYSAPGEEVCADDPWGPPGDGEVG